MASTTLMARVARRVASFALSQPSICAVQRVVTLRHGLSCVRERLQELSPKLACGWRGPKSSRCDPCVGLSMVVRIGNEESFVGGCLNSIATQETSCKFEVVVIDDGSTDGSAADVDADAAADGRIRTVHQPNHGFSGAKNVDIELLGGVHVSLTPMMYSHLHLSKC